MFDFLNPTAFGLDISDESIKAVQFEKRKNRLRLFRFNSKKIPVGIIENGEIKEPMALTEIIKETLCKSKPFPIKCKYVICSLPEPKCFMQVVKLPQMSESEVAEAIKWKAEGQFPLKAEEMNLDWQILEKNEKRNLAIFKKREFKDSSKVSVFLAAVSRDLANSYIAVLEKAGLIPIVLEPESIATGRSLISEKENLGAVMIIDLGKKRTNFIIYEEPAIRFTSDILLSGDLLTKAVADEFKIDFNEAEKMKIEFGLDATKKDGRIVKAILPHLSQLVKKIDQSRNYYYSEYFDSFNKSGTMSKIILCGGGANLSGIASFLSLRIKKEIEIGNPLVNFIKPQSKGIPFISYEESLSYTTVFGLALRGFQMFLPTA